MKTNLSIYIDGLETSCFAGIYPHEIGNRQKLKIDVRIWLVTTKRQIKTLDDTLDYDKAVKIIENTADQKHWPLLENLAQSITDKFFDSNQVSRIWLKICKAESMKNSAAIGIIFEKEKQL